MSARDDFPYLAEYCSFPMRSSTIREADKALDEIDTLRRWKSEALIVLGWWDDAFERCEPLGRLGERRATVMADEILRLRAEINALTARAALNTDVS